jgi:pimeloyl-ACP methyl ester carboxylesterase
VLEHVVEASDGRRLAVVERGDPGGLPVVFHHGTPGSRLGRHPDEAVYEGVRAIFYDRPGYGGSDALPGRSVATAAADTSAIVDALGVDRFAVEGGSGGGPHALACGALLGERVTKVAVVVGAAPSDDPDLDWMSGMNDLNRAEVAAALEGPLALEAFLQRFASQALTNPDAVIEEIAASVPEADQAVMARPVVRAILAEALAESVRQGVGGWADDDLAFVKPWGFDLSEVKQEVRLWQGELDVLVPRAHAEYLESKLPHARFDLVPHAGHMLIDQIPDVVHWLLA